MISISELNGFALKVEYSNSSLTRIIPKSGARVLFNRDKVALDLDGERIFYEDYEDITPLAASAEASAEAISLLIGQGTVSSYISEISMGRRQGKEVVNKWGHNGDIGIGTEIAASWGGVFNPVTDIITVAQSFTITYDSDFDGDGKTGATLLTFVYLDSNFNKQVGTHVLGSSGTDETAFEGIGINRVFVTSNGGLGFNAKKITIKATIDETTQAEIPEESSVTQQCIFHTQIDHNFLASWVRTNVLKTAGGSSPIIIVTGYSWSRVTLTRYQVYQEKLNTADESVLDVKPPVPFIVGGREVLYFVITSDKINTIVDMRFSGVEEKI